MLPNDHRLALLQANATMVERHRQAAQDRLVAPRRTTAHRATLSQPNKRASLINPSIRRAASGVALLFALTTLLGLVPLATWSVPADGPGLAQGGHVALKVAATSRRSMTR
jgi:hypothetical protein